MNKELVQQGIGNVFCDQTSAFSIGMRAVAGVLAKGFIGDSTVMDINDGIIVGRSDGGNFCVEVTDGISVFVGGRVGLRIVVHVTCAGLQQRAEIDLRIRIQGGELLEHEFIRIAEVGNNAFILWAGRCERA